MNKAILLNSGGLDSLVVANYLTNILDYELYSLYIDFGQLNGVRAKESSRRIAQKYCKLGHEEISILSDRRNTFSTTNGLLYKKNSSVPFNPLVMFGIGTIISYNEQNIKYIATGYKSDSRDIKITLNAVNVLLHEQNFREPHFILTPLGNFKTLKETLEKGLEEGLTLEELSLTVSCLEETPCNTCFKCTDRADLGLSMN